MEYHQVFSNLRTVPTRNHFNRMSKISWSALNVRFGSQAKIVARYGDWLRATQPESDLIERLPIEKNQSDLVSLTVSASDEPQQHKAQWAKTERTVYGEPISFRGLRHAPVNEQGVVYLFGMVSFELGFLVEAVHSAFPDCEAKRCINRKENRWQRVLIEFEFRSRNFRDHGHNPQGCDLIVCWEHDWNDCLLEVLELRKVLTTLDVSPL